VEPAPQSPTRSVAPTLQRFIEAQRGTGMLLLWAIVVGALTGVVGGLFRLSVSSVSSGLLRVAGGISEQGLPGWLFPLVSTAVLVVLATWLVQRFAPEARGSGVQEIEGALDGLRPVRWRRVLPVKFVGGVLSLGAGMVMGREGPIIQMGGTVGRMLSDVFRRSDEDAHTLVAAGAGAGLAAAFNAPLAGMLFVIEEMRPQFHYSVVSVQCVLVACATADVVVQLLVGPELVIPMGALVEPQLSAMWIFLLLGALFGLLGLAFNATLLALLDVFDRVPPAARWLAAAAVGAAVGLLGWANPDMVGGGYRAISDALSGRLFATGLLVLFAVRFFVTLVCFASGPPGGIFAPMLALGTLLGLALGNFAHGAFPEAVPEAGVFVVAGMGALFSATVRAPITGIVLAAELTGSYAQILPLAIACVAATIVAHRLGGQPIYTVLLERALRPSVGPKQP
jgi:CIC family chloride channel protein